VSDASALPEGGTNEGVLRLDDRGRALLSMGEAASVLGVGISTVYGLLKSGELPYLHIVGKTKIAASDLAGLIAKKRAEKPDFRKVPWSKSAPARRKATLAARRSPGQTQ
jgi:excisionase family DNA binding protein